MSHAHVTNPDGIPRFTCTESAKGALSQGTFIHHNNRPMLVAKVMKNEDGTFWLKIIRNPEHADDDQIKEIQERMREWYYYNFVRFVDKEST